MPTYRTRDIRNIALAGHSGSGKTTLAEALLVKSGVKGEAGTVERGSTTMDHDPLERQYQHSLDSSIASLNYKGMHLNLIDTAGIADFRGPTLASLTAVETTAIVINAHSGIELATRRLMRRAKQRRLCRMIIINRIDVDDVDLAQIVKDLRTEFGPECLPVNLPAENLSKVRDCFFHTEGETDIFSLTEAHDAIVDQVVEVNDELMEKFLEGEELSREDLHAAFDQALREGHLVPICFTSALTGAGVEELLEFFNQLAPSPREGNPPPFIKGEGDAAVDVTATASATDHVLAHVFKITNDPFVGKLSIFRIH